MKASTFCQPALTCYKTQGQYIDDITRWREDMNIRVVKTIFYDQLMYHHVMFFLLCGQKSEQAKH